MNSICPLPYCGSKTEGKAVRGMNFCKEHHPLAVFVRDDMTIKREEAKRGRIFSGQQFVRIIVDVVDEAVRQNLKL
jgi:hypothetical protein